MTTASPPFQGTRALIVHDAVGTDARPDEQDTLRQVLAVRAAMNMLGVQTRTFAVPHDRAALDSAGLAPGDVLVALDGLRVTQRTLDKQLQRLRPEQRVRTHAFRRDELIQCELRVQACAADTCHLSPVADTALRQRRQRWLGPGDKR